MKQYKVVRVKLSLTDIGTGDFSKMESVMNDMAKDGWKVVSHSPQPGVSTTYMLVTLSKDTAE